VSGIREYIRDEVLRRRLKQASVMVVYDPTHRYLDLCQELVDETIAVVDASERGIESREAALQTFVDLARQAADGPKELLLYVPTKAPQSDEDRMKDPFAIYTVCGGIFPDGDGDEYLSLCLKAKPDHVTEIRGLFEKDASPSFELVDNIGGGIGYPTLRTLLKVDSARNILLALLAPSAQQKDHLKGNQAWLPEARTLFRASLGLRLVTKGKSWSAVADELWRFILYSEFVFDLPGDLPASLGTVPRAIDDASLLVDDLCETLRHDIRTQQIYIDRAEQVEASLNLPEVCTGIEDLGRRDTFLFEERTFLASAVRALKEDRLDDIRDIVTNHRDSVWLGKGESQAQWGLVDAALSLVAECEDAERGLADHARSLEALIDHYADRLREIDRLQREFEQAVGQYLSVDTIVDAVTDHARGRYAKITEKTQVIFTKHLEMVGWPPQGRLANADVFDSFVAPLLGERGRRVAYFMVDALRYELGLELHRQLANDDAAEIVAAHAQFPTVTPIGMASLLPSAGAKLRVERDGNSVTASLDGQTIGTVAQRMGVLKAMYGDRFAEMTLSNFINGKKVSISATVDLLVLRSTEIDSNLENNPESTLGLVHQALRAIRVAVHRLKDSGFSDIIIATDHGFFLNGHANAGDLCAKPPGNWLNVHDRSLLCDGSGDIHNFAVPTEKVGIRSDLSTFCAPRSMAPYRRGLLFFHGGPSLQEAVVPVITVKLQKGRPSEQAQTSVVLTYRDGAKRITTRLPVVNVMVESTDMFAQETDVEILIEAHDKNGAVVGEAKRGDLVDPATGTLTMKPGQQKQVTVRMDLEFEGKFTLKALNPVTMAAYSAVDLETDYAV